MSKVTKQEFAEHYKPYLFGTKSDYMLQMECFVEAVLKLCDDSGYIEDFMPQDVYEAHVDSMDEESQEINRGRFNNFVAISMMSCLHNLMRLGFLESEGKGDHHSVQLCLPD